MGWFWQKWDIEQLKREIEAAMDQSFNPMANQTLSEGDADLMFPTVIFNVDTPEVERAMENGGEVPGYVVWETGARAPFVATIQDRDVFVSFGAWELVEANRPYLA